MLAGRKLGVIGVGNMGTALDPGLVEYRPAQTNGNSYCRPVRRNGWKACTGNTDLQAADNRQVAARADIVLLAVKPQVIPEVMAELQTQLDGSRLVISIAAGIPLSLLADMLPTGPADAGHAQHPHPGPGRDGGGGPRTPGRRRRIWN